MQEEADRHAESDSPVSATGATPPPAPHALQHNLDHFLSRIDSILESASMSIRVMSQTRGRRRDALEGFLASKARKSTYEDNQYEIPNEVFPEFKRLNRKLERSELAHVSVTRALIVALVSEFDAFMAATLRVFYMLKPDALSSSSRTLTFSQLLAFETIEAAREDVLEKEVEAFLRSSHTEQFNVLEQKFGIRIPRDSQVWKSFIELTERRNLFVHNDGIVNDQYIQNCLKAGVERASPPKGSRLAAPQSYFVRSNETLYELAARLTHILWRKLSPGGLDEAADAHIAGSLVYELLYEKRYRLAQALAEFGATEFRKWASDYYRRAFIVNRAQAYIWDGQYETGRKLLDSEDWSATSSEFQLCVATLERDYEKAIEHMRRLGPMVGPRKDGYRDWPVFQELRDQEAFQAAFFEVYGEPLSTVSVQLSVDGTAEGSQQ